MKGLRAATMLYRKGTQERLHDVHVDTIIVDESEVDTYLDEGWYRSPKEAGREEHNPSAYTVTRQHEELLSRMDAIDAEEQRLIAMREELDRRSAEIEQRAAAQANAAAANAAAKTSTKPAAAKPSEKQS